MLELIDADLRPGCEVLERPDWKIVSAIDVLAAVGARVVDLAATKGVRLEVRAGAGAVRGNLESLVEALGNIVRNAIEMSPSGGPVVVSSFRCVDGGQLWTVRDTGPGIPSHELPNIGRPYFSRRPGGSGLGVAVARDIVESHGGVTQFTPSPGGGTLVSIRLPPAHEI